MPIYVVQVIGGEEHKVQSLISKMVPRELVHECFVPTSEVARRSAGVWSRMQRTMFPGYVFVDTPDALALEAELRRIPHFTRVLGNEGRCIPLTEAEVAWLNAVTSKDSRLIGMSEGVIEGGQVLILNGPLMGRTYMIKKIDRHKRMAYLEVDMCGRSNLVKLGLEIKSKN